MGEVYRARDTRPGREGRSQGAAVARRRRPRPAPAIREGSPVGVVPQPSQRRHGLRDRGVGRDVQSTAVGRRNPASAARSQLAVTRSTRMAAAPPPRVRPGAGHPGNIWCVWIRRRWRQSAETGQGSWVMRSGKSMNDPRRSLPASQGEAGSDLRRFDSVPEVREPVERLASEASRGREDRSAFAVREVMTRNARSCRPDDRLAAAALTMCEGDCRFLAVVDGIGRPVGVITDGDICVLGATDRRPLREILVREAMTGPPATCRADDDLLDAIKTMREQRIRHLPVVNAEGLLEGVVSLTDLVLCAEEHDSSFLREEVAAALRSIMQKRGNYRVIRHNPFVED